MSEPDIDTVMVAVDGSPQSLQALRGGAAIAASLGAELLGLFVEDTALLQLANLPIVQEVRTYTATVRQIDPDAVRGHLRRETRRVRRAVELVASRSQVSWHFDVRRGSVADELLRAIEEADLIVLGRGSRIGQRRLGSTARTILLQTTRPVLMLDRPLPSEPHALVLFDGSERSERTLDLALQLVQGSGGYLTLACAASSSERALSAQRSGFRRLREQGREAQCRWIIEPTLEKLALVVRAERPDLVAVPGDTALLRGRQLARLLVEISAPVLVVR